MQIGSCRLASVASRYLAAKKRDCLWHVRYILRESYTYSTTSSYVHTLSFSFHIIVIITSCLLCDVQSALDPSVADHVFRHAIKGLLADKTVLFVANHVKVQALNDLAQCV